jgi:15-cis-phytoene synthase
LTGGAFEHREAIERHSRSFALASRLLPRHAADNAAIVYAWCRRADDAIDESGAESPRLALSRLRFELGELYTDGAPSDPVLAAFRGVLRATSIPWQYPADLLLGMEMDVDGHEYERFADLLAYSYRVASTVGLMMCHVMGVSHGAALRHAAHLGLAMQLTNICRDVQEDWQRGRLYLPEELLARHGVRGLGRRRGEPFPTDAVDGCRGALAELLGIAERYYASSDAGLVYLSWRSALGVNAARRIYSAIGAELARQRWNVLAPRAVVSTPRKLLLCVQAAGATLGRRLSSLHPPFEAVPLSTVQHGSELIPL